MKLAITGASGLIGQAIVNDFRTKGHEVTELVRGNQWDPEQYRIDDSILTDIDVVINLAGENIVGRWNDKKKKEILESRIKATKTIVDGVKKAKNPPKILFNASAIGYYGCRGEEVLNEESIAGNNFLSEVCQKWEEAALQLTGTHTRVVLLRFGIVLSGKGGALAKMKTPFNFGLGGILGDGKQYMSWISIEDVPGVISFLIENGQITGPVNVVTAEPVTNYEFTKTLANVLKRPAILPVPAFAARWLFGEVADEMLLCSTRVQPSVLTKNEYNFRYPELHQAIVHLLS